MPLQIMGCQACHGVAHHFPELLEKLVVLALGIALMAWCAVSYEGLAGVLQPFRPVWKLTKTHHGNKGGHQNIPWAYWKFGDSDARRALSSGVSQT